MKSSQLLAIAMGTLLGGAALAQDSGSSSGDDQAKAESPLSTETDLAASPVLGPKGFEVGLRAGYALPLGDVSSGNAYSDFTKGIVPLQLDVGYRINGNWFAGAYFQYGLTNVKVPECDQSGVSCSASDLRFGIEGQYHLMPANALDPWVGLGVGYEVYHSSESAGGMEASGSTNGFEFLNATVGADYKLAPNLGVGPFLGLSLGEFSNASFSSPGQPDQSGSIQDKALHLALSFGLRGVFDVM